MGRRHAPDPPDQGGLIGGLAYRGADGARAILDLLVTELADAMVLSGQPRLADVDRTLLHPFPPM